MTGNLQEILHQVESKRQKNCASIRGEREGEKCSKTFYKIIERQNMQNQTISELYT